MRLTEFTTLLYFLSKNKNREVSQFDKNLDKMDEFLGGLRL